MTRFCVKLCCFIAVLLVYFAGSPSRAFLVPVEVDYPTRVLQSITLTVPASSLTNGPIAMLNLQINNVEYPGEVAVRVGTLPWIDLSNSTATAYGPGSQYGGIGGPVTTLSLHVPLPSGAATSGDNTVQFNFAHSDGNCSSFRVLAVNFATANGSTVVDTSTRTVDNPANWQPPLNNSTDIAIGRALFTGATLVFPLTPKPMIAHCGSCHASDGRDLKYFNYDNETIIARSVFHGLTVRQGAQIASYIRSLPASEGSVNGRPWNPPFQPGPGLSQVPLTEWSAGAGLTAVLNSDNDELPYLFPNGITSSAVATMITQGANQINPRNIPTSLPLLTWDQWLPKTGPEDIIPANTLSAFLQSVDDYFTPLILASTTTESYLGGLTGAEDINFGNMMTSFGLSSPQSAWTPALAQEEYSMQQWWAVRGWETLQQAIAAHPTMSKTWPDNRLFVTSPNRGFIPAGMLTGSTLSDEFLSNAWYMAQLVTNSGGNQAKGNSPVDYNYFYGHIGGLYADGGPAQPIRLTEAMLLGMRNYNGNQLGLYVWIGGFRPFAEGLALKLVQPNLLPLWSTVNASTTTEILNAVTANYVSGVRRFTPAQYYAGNVASTADTPGYVYQNWISAVYEAIPVLHQLGVDSLITKGLAQWAATLWPGTDWGSLAGA